MKQGNQEFTLDYGTRLSSEKDIDVKVKIDPSIMVKDFAQAYAKELIRLNPARAKSDPITATELYTYFQGILALRVQMVNNDCKDYRAAKRLAIPTWIQFTISKVGLVFDRLRGLCFKPEMKFDFKMDELLAISLRLQAYEVDGLGLHMDAFPRDWSGDLNVMSMAIIGDYVNSITDTPTPVHSYVAAFLGQKLVEEKTFSMLYRVRYDEYSYILQQLIHDKTVLS